MSQTKYRYFLSFVVIFKLTSNKSFLRVSHSQQILQEVDCDSITKIINIPLECQDDIRFQFFSEDSNMCTFIGAGISKESSKLTHLLFLDPPHVRHAKETMFGEGQLSPLFSERECTFKSSLKILPSISSRDRVVTWIDDNDKKTYSAVPAYWIARYRSGVACFYRNGGSKRFPSLNVFSKVEFDNKNNVVKLIKLNKFQIIIPSDRLLGCKSVTSELEYLNFVRNAFFLLPSVLDHTDHFIE